MDRLKGSLEHIVFHNEKNGYTVADFDVDGEMVTVVGTMESPKMGIFLAMEGIWREHPTYGHQFQMENYRIDLPTSEEGLVRYLSSGLLPGIGEKIALEIVQTFGDKTMDVLDHHPKALLSVHGIGKKTLARMMAAYEEQREVRNVLMELQEYGISSRTALKLYAVYHEATVGVLLEDPYRIVKDVRGIGFKVADQLAVRLGFETTSEKRVRAGVVQSLRECYARGNTYMTEEELFESSERFLGVPREAIEMAMADLVLSGGMHADEIDGQTVYYPMGLYEAEDHTALVITQLVAGSGEAPQKSGVDLDRAVSDYEQAMQIKLDAVQADAVRTAIAQGVAIITGGPGTGKTTIINGILTILKGMQQSVLLAAPTGRAAKRMTETTGEAAKTIHRLLEYTYSDDETFSSFERNEDNPLEADALIVDEASMIDITLMDSLLSAIKIGTRLILVGDADQLPSVGPGNVLSDLIESGAVPVVRLEHIYRQSEKSMISVNARAINDGIVPEIDNHSDFVFMRKSSQEDIAQTILDLMQWRLRDNLGIESDRDVQVISPIKKGIIGVAHLNQQLQAVLNPPGPDKNERTLGPIVFREGDKVMQVRNNYQLRWEDREAVDEGEGIYNGDIGQIMHISTQAKVVTVRFSDGKWVHYDFEQLDELTHAFAMTVHKSQGSEFPVVIMPMVGGSPMFLNRKLLYTGVTRAKRMIILVGNFDHFVRMIRAGSSRERRTGLKARIACYEAIKL